MLELHESLEPLLTHALTPLGPLPAVQDPDGVYPYDSFAETSHRPVLKCYRFITIENAHLRVTVCPDLGGKIHSLFDKRSNQEVLFVPKSICPVRILPRLGFIPGGIEVSFPISHSPVQLEAVAWEAERLDDRLYIWCGERELRFGLQWTVEFSLGEDDTFLTQRTCFRNPTAQAHPWMSWSNAAVPARPDTEFHFPNGPVLYHSTALRTIDWAAEGPRRVGDLSGMAGFFWLKPDACAFGAFTPGRGHGLYHIADPALAPGIKLWTYGVGADEIWGQAASLSGETYVEIQGGPVRDQSIKAILQPGQHCFHVEFWLPSSTPCDIRTLPLPQPELMPLPQQPIFNWPPCPSTNYWLSVSEACVKGRAHDLPEPPGLDHNLWAPSGMEDLGDALSWAAAITRGTTHDRWLLQWGTWQAARGQVEAALETLAQSHDDQAKAVAGRLYLRGQKSPRAAADSFRAIRTEALVLHPQILIERDLALAELGNESLAERGEWFARVANTQDEWLLERKAAWLADQGRFHEASALLEQTPFQLVHQRYVRSRLRNRIQKGLGQPETAPPAWLGEDDLVAFGAYREFEGG